MLIVKCLLPKQKLKIQSSVLVILLKLSKKPILTSTNGKKLSITYKNKAAGGTVCGIFIILFIVCIATSGKGGTPGWLTFICFLIAVIPITVCMTVGIQNADNTYDTQEKPAISAVNVYQAVLDQVNEHRDIFDPVLLSEIKNQENIPQYARDYINVFNE